MLSSMCQLHVVWGKCIGFYARNALCILGTLSNSFFNISHGFSLTSSILTVVVNSWRLCLETNTFVSSANNTEKNISLTLGKSFT